MSAPVGDRAPGPLSESKEPLRTHTPAQYGRHTEALGEKDHVPNGLLTGSTSIHLSGLRFEVTSRKVFPDLSVHLFYLLKICIFLLNLQG